jgi:hypothetical protein
MGAGRLVSAMNPNQNSDRFILAAVQYSKWLAAYKAEEPAAATMLDHLIADPRSFALTVMASGEMYCGLLEKLYRDDDLGGPAQLFLDRQTLSYGHAADQVVRATGAVSADD